MGCQPSLCSNDINECCHCTLSIVMRTYGDYKKNQNGKRELYRNRESNQWDIRLDVEEDDIVSIKDHVLKNKSKILYFLMSGLEFGTHALGHRHEGIKLIESQHVHVALILHGPCKREDALNIVRPTRLKGEYAVPRNGKFTYLGWRLHHLKKDTKINDEHLLMEFGTLPLDEINEKNIKEIQRMMKKFESKYVDERYTAFVTTECQRFVKKRRIEKLENQLIAEQESLKELDECKLMTLEDINVEVNP